jgi:uracil-DNA glycosylase
MRGEPPAVAAPAAAPGLGPSGGAPAPTPASPLNPQASSLGVAERRERLTVLAEEVRGCTRCALHEARTQTVFARGNGSSGLCFVGEGPGADEDLQGFPFVGAAGQLLDKMITAMGIARDDVYVCNIVKCRPPKNRTPEPEEMSTCMPYLTEQLSLVEPQVIVALGKTAVQGLFGTAEGITRIRGRWRLYQGRIAVMPTFHPAYLLRNPAAKREVWQDLQLVLKHMGRSVPGR